MTDFLGTYYLYLKAFHIIAVVAWMAGLLYLPRLFVYHAGSEKGSAQSETFKIMEKKLLRIIMNPAMIAAWILGGLMFWANPDLLKQGWMHVKMTGFILMTVLHHVFVRWRKNFERDENTHSEKFYRLWNEVPALIMIIIIIMAVAEPF